MNAQPGSLTARTAVWRAFRLRCPRCGGGRLFKNLLQMHAACPACKLRYERAPGYFLGSAYVNYGVTALLLTATYVGLHFGAGYENFSLTPLLLGFCVVFPLFFFRYARSIWLALDCLLDTSDPEEQT